MGRYGHNEYRYARPIAEELERNTSFRSWVLTRTKFAQFSQEAELLHEQQKLCRTPQSENWWRSHFAGPSYQFKSECGERETDLLAIFGVRNDFRFAIHFEVKAPGDRFGIDQALDYQRRAVCWSGRGRAPRTVLPHDEATTVLCCEREFAERVASEVSNFPTIITFEEISVWIAPFPDLV
jgi:hypothetical protein